MRNIQNECIKEGCKTDYCTWERKLDNGKQNVVLLNGYWIWWCITHNQPLYKCAEERLLNEIAENICSAQNEESDR